MNRANRFDQLFNGIAIAVQQGSLLVSRSPFQRAVVMISVVGLMFLHVSYSAKIFSLIQAPLERIDSLSELLNSRFEVGGHDIPYNHFYLTGLFAFHAINSAVVHVISETFDETEKCYIRELQFVDSSDIYLAVQQNFTFREHFQVGLARIRETGVYKREYGMIRLEAKLNCVKGVDFQSLSFVDVRFAMELMGGGLVGALALLALEIIWERYHRSRLPVFEYVN
ncbi:hypothetical protein pipiens_019494 [Culex pipiens pipiens]|uniref:Ionotropic receptor n=1 Tax=Culex pipiens pipiens TaxID=38569 RepID=A0ABD1DTR9_CULPP